MGPIHKPLHIWLPAVQIPPQWRDLLIGDLHLDSRQIRPGDGFLALAANPNQRAAHAQQALAAGAVAIIFDALQAPPIQAPPGVALLGVPALAAELPQLAAAFYDFPCRDLKLIGVTGTNGKSTCVYLLAQLLSAASGAPAGLLGTLGYGLSGEALTATGMTTPDVVSNQRILRRLYERGARAVAMEVSSHGLTQARVAGLDFCAAVFTNLSRDHLDYHPNMAAYAAAKQLLFACPSLQVAALNFDDAQAGMMCKPLVNTACLLSYSLQAPATDWRAEAPLYTPQGAEFSVHTPSGLCRLQSPLMGEFNIYNLLACMAITLHFYPSSWARLPSWVAQLQPVAGRMQQIVGAHQPVVVVDYAHTPDALAQALTNLRRHCCGQLWVIFGCGGERDVGKRPQMAAIAERLADRVVVTSDNPRSENALAIIAAIRQGFSHPELVSEIADRDQAITQTIRLAQSDDWILIAGKGHENYQLIGAQCLPFDDVQHAQAALALRGVC